MEKPLFPRRLAIGTAVLFLVSAAFPIAAGVARDTGAFPRWWGPLDVALAFVLALVTMAVFAIGQKKIDAQIEAATYRAYRVLIHGIMAVLVIFFLAGDRITWINCLTGIAWRTWLLLYALPAWLALMKTEPNQEAARSA